MLLFADADVAFTANQKVQLAPLGEAAERRLAAEGAEVAGHRYGETR